jgi:phosphatidylglycerophosphatase A
MNHQRRIILKRLFKLCSLLIGSYNINIGPETTNTMLTSFVTYSRLRSMMNLLLRIITNIMFEAHFTISTNSMFEADCSSKDPQNPSTDEPTLNVDDYMDSDNTMVEYNLNR